MGAGGKDGSPHSPSLVAAEMAGRGTDRREWPAASHAAAGLHRSCELARAIAAGFLSSQQPEADFSPRRTFPGSGKAGQALDHGKCPVLHRVGYPEPVIIVGAMEAEPPDRMTNGFALDARSRWWERMAVQSCFSFAVVSRTRHAIFWPGRIPAWPKISFNFRI